MHHRTRNPSSIEKDATDYKNNIEAIYSEICSQLERANFKPTIKEVRGFTFIHVKQLSVFILDGILYIIDSKLPPRIYKNSIHDPNFDIIETIINAHNIS